LAFRGRSPDACHPGQLTLARTRRPRRILAPPIDESIDVEN
jgi:hypothetical protein